jgi:LacI family transcriptional regulator
LASNDLTAIGIMGAVYAAGLRVPEDISVVGFDDIALSSFVSPPLTTIRLSRAEIAEFAFTSLYAASQRGETRGVTHIIRAELVIRQSTAAIRPEVEGSVSLPAHAAEWGRRGARGSGTRA